MKASSFVKDPPETLKKVIEEVQQAANHSQSEAYHYHAAGDGSVVEIRCAPEPTFRGKSLPEVNDENEGHLAEKNGKLYRAVPVPVEVAENPGELFKADDGKRRRSVQALNPGAPHPLYEDEVVPADRPQYALVEYDWVEVSPVWKEHAVKKATDVRLKALRF